MSIHANENHSNIMFQTNPHINIQLDQKKTCYYFDWFNYDHILLSMFENHQKE
jgi:hypothetical protein